MADIDVPYLRHDSCPFNVNSILEIVSNVRNKRSQWASVNTLLDSSKHPSLVAIDLAKRKFQRQNGIVRWNAFLCSRKNEG